MSPYHVCRLPNTVVRNSNSLLVCEFPQLRNCLMKYVASIPSTSFLMTHGDPILYLRVQRETNASGDDELCDPEHAGTIVRS